MIDIVIGIGYGDEGKGVVTDYLCSLTHPKDTIVCRFTGGHQAGHTVQIGNKRHVFSNFGSGTLRGVDTYWSSVCTVDPVGIMREYNKLKLLVKEMPILYIHNDCPIVTPYDKAENVFYEAIRNNGTCGVGYGATIEREEIYYKLHVFDTNYPTVFEEKVSLISKRFPWAKANIYEFREAIEFIKKCPTIHFVNRMPKRRHEIYEGSQGLMLDKDLGFFPHVTRGNTGVQNLIDKCTDTNYWDYHSADPVNYYFVTRAYATRHGKGPFDESIEGLNFTESSKIETNVLNEYQGEFKKGVLNLEVLTYGLDKMLQKYPLIKKFVNYNLVVTCLDHIEEPYPLKVEGELELLPKVKFIKKIAESFSITFDKVYTNNSPEGKLHKIYLDR